MNAQTLKALRASIAHWERLATGKRRKGEGIGSGHCALCQMFYVKTGTCDGCPIHKKLGRSCCMGTPYENAEDAWQECGIDSAEFKAAAQKEIEFLESLLPTLDK